MNTMKKISAVLLVVSALLLASCGGDSGSSGGSTPSTKPLDVELTTSKDKLFTIEDYNIDVYEAPLNVTFTASRNADIEVTIWYTDGTSSEPVVEKYSSRKSVEISLDRDCNVYYTAVATDDKMSNGAGISVAFNKLKKPSLSVEGTAVTTDQIEVAGNQYLTIESWFPYGGFPSLVYTTDGSDPKTSSTAKTEGVGSAWISYQEEMTELKAYMKMDDWKDSDVLDVKLNQRVTPTPSVTEAEEGVITVMYNDMITLAGANGQIWYTTDVTLPKESIDPSVPGGSWEESKTRWVEAMGLNTPALNSGNTEVLFVAKEEGSKYSDAVKYTVENKLPAPELYDRTEDKVNNTQTLRFYKRSDIPEIQFNCNKDYSTVGSFYVITVPTGSEVRAYFTKTNFTKSQTTKVYAANKLTTPVPTVTYVDSQHKYKKLELTSPEGGTIKYILDGVEYTYSGYIEVRETTTITYWAEKAKFESSDQGSRKITVDYNVGDIGPAGGIIVFAGSYSSSRGYDYMELARVGSSNEIYGYYAAKSGDEAKKVGATDTWGKVNTELLISKMSNGHAFTDMVNELFKKQIVSGMTDKFAAKTAGNYSLPVTIHGRSSKVTYDDWYLPSIDELSTILTLQRKGTISSSIIQEGEYFWSSSESSAGAAWYAFIDSKFGVRTSDLPIKGNKCAILYVRYFY